MSKLKLTFYGVRGSSPAPSRKTAKYGGNTPCIDMIYGDERIILDAGTGIRELGLKLTKKRSKATILFSHYHWDHISGLPFFAPLYNKGNAFDLIGPKPKGSNIKKLLCKAIEPPVFPISLRTVPARMGYKDISDKPFKIGSVEVVPFYLSHPGDALGYRFNFPDGKSLIYISDNEPSHKLDDLVDWAYGADILICEAQYTPAEYEIKRGWGHSPYTFTVGFALTAGVKKLVLNHFDPAYDDRKLEMILKDSRKIAKKLGSKMKIELAREI